MIMVERTVPHSLHVVPVGRFCVVQRQNGPFSWLFYCHRTRRAGAMRVKCVMADTASGGALLADRPCLVAFDTA